MSNENDVPLCAFLDFLDSNLNHEANIVPADETQLKEIAALVVNVEFDEHGDLL